jgi:hypothetical protein
MAARGICFRLYPSCRSTEHHRGANVSGADVGREVLARARAGGESGDTDPSGHTTGLVIIQCGLAVNGSVIDGSSSSCNGSSRGNADGR